MSDHEQRLLEALKETVGELELWIQPSPQVHMDRVNAVMKTAREAIQSYEQGTVEVSDGWIAVSDRLPSDPNPVIIYGGNENGKARTLRSMYARKFELKSFDDDEMSDYSEEKDEFYAPEGWYECNEYEDVHWAIQFVPTHWRPLPSPPKGAGNE